MNLQNTEIKRVLIIKSCRMNQFYSNLKTLKKSMGQDIVIDILAQSGVKKELDAKEEIRQVLIYDKGHFKVKNIAQELWDKIRGSYDVFVILYNAPYYSAKGYHQINKIARLSKARYVIGIDIEERVFITYCNWLWLKMLEKYCHFFFSLGSIILLLPFIAIIFIGRFVIYGVSKIRRPLLLEETSQKLPGEKLHNQMKILYFGLVQSVHFKKWVRYFVERKHEVHIISILPLHDFDIQGVNIHILKHTRGNLCSSPLIDILMLYGRLKKLIKEINPDIIHFHHITLSAFVFALINFHPLVLTAWDPELLIKAKESQALRWLVRFILKNGDLLTCDAEHIEELFKELGVNPERIKLINFGIDTKKFTPGHKDNRLLEKLEIFDSPTIISLRSLFPLYDVASLIRAASLVLREVPEVKLIIVGGGSEEPELKKLADSLGVSGSIRFVGYIPNDELPLYLRSVDIYVSTSLSDGGIAACTAEAMACGLPVVITDFGDNRKWVEDGLNGFIIPLRNPEVLASRIICLIHDKDLREKFGQVNRQIIEERNDWKKEMGKVERLYERSIKRYEDRK
ncbi:MAG: glycosyltransferase family 4 protein [bacterium]|nr:glycosyltransferase family 4 protein [bacterium]